MLDPVAQIKKAEDADKRNSLLQAKNALDQYYHDKGRFPDAASYQTDLTGGNYIKKVRSDALYKVDSANGQWFVLLLKKSSVVSYGTTTDCQLACTSIAKPSEYICSFEGNVDVSQC